MIHAVDGMGPGSLSRGMSDDLENMLLMVQTDATDALRTHSANALGRLHQVKKILHNILRLLPQVPAINFLGIDSICGNVSRRHGYHGTDTPSLPFLC